MITLNDIIQFLISPNFTGWLLVVKIIFIVLCSFFLFFILFILTKTTWLRRLFIWNLIEFLTYRPFGTKKIARQWLEIKKRLDTGLESEYKLSIIEADSILNENLEKMGYKGETTGERLKNLTDVVLPNLGDILEAHKIRNNIIHDPDYRLNLDVAQKLISDYEKTLIDLGVL
jgi:hypothetical protein